MEHIMNLYVRNANDYRIATTDEVVSKAKCAINKKYRRGQTFSSPKVVEEYLQVKLGFEDNEKFVALWLDGRHRLIAYEELFHGTIDGTSVYPRVVVQKAIAHNAAAAIFAHPHPSGVAEPSQADERITRRLKSALELVDIRLLDHIVVGERCVSLAARGLL
ncbi:MAG: JAB domain-containing protein [Woeseia sp.]